MFLSGCQTSFRFVKCYDHPYDNVSVVYHLAGNVALAPEHV